MVGRSPSHRLRERLYHWFVRYVILGFMFGVPKPNNVPFISDSHENDRFDEISLYVDARPTFSNTEQCKHEHDVVALP